MRLVDKQITSCPAVVLISVILYNFTFHCVFLTSPCTAGVEHGRLYLSCEQTKGNVPLLSLLPLVSVNTTCVTIGCMLTSLPLSLLPPPPFLPPSPLQWHSWQWLICTLPSPNNGRPHPPVHSNWWSSRHSGWRGICWKRYPPHQAEDT